MRRRAKRDLITLVGVAAIIAGIVGINAYFHLDTMKDKFKQMRVALETKHRNEGVDLLDWKTMRTTKGTYRSGATFKEELEKLDGKIVNIVGFMNPIDQFSNVTEFMLLPLPIDCYFCQRPPMRDVIEVKLMEPSNMVKEPVLIGGYLKLNKGKNQPFFFTIEKGLWNEVASVEKYNRLRMQKKHREHQIEGFQKLLEPQKEKELVAPQETPEFDESMLETPPAENQ